MFLMILEVFLYGSLMFMDGVHLPQDKMPLFGIVKFAIWPPVNWYSFYPPQKDECLS